MRPPCFSRQQAPPDTPVRQGAAALEPDAAELWFAGRQLEAGAPLSARLGRNDKTRVVVRLQQRGGGAPMREPVQSLQQ